MHLLGSVLAIGWRIEEACVGLPSLEKEHRIWQQRLPLRPLLDPILPSHCLVLPPTSPIPKSHIAELKCYLPLAAWWRPLSGTGPSAGAPCSPEAMNVLYGMFMMLRARGMCLPLVLQSSRWALHFFLPLCRLYCYLRVS